MHGLVGADRPMGPVVAAVSGSPSDEAVVLEAARVARLLGLRFVIVLHVVDTTRLPVPPDSPEGRAMLDGLRSRALDVYEASSRILESLGLEAVPAFREGRPCGEIVGFAEKAGGILVMAPSESGEGLGGTLLCVASKFRGNILVAKSGGARGG